MPVIRPISDLRNRALEISELCHTEEQPVFITRNGKGDMVVMSQAHYERLQSLIELYPGYRTLPCNPNVCLIVTCLKMQVVSISVRPTQALDS